MCQPLVLMYDLGNCVPFTLDAHRGSVMLTYIHIHKILFKHASPNNKMLVSMGGRVDKLQIHRHIVFKRKNTHVQ